MKMPFVMDITKVKKNISIMNPENKTDKTVKIS